MTPEPLAMVQESSKQVVPIASTAAELFIHSNTYVTNNTANGGSGGGLRTDGKANVHIDEAQIWFYNHHADSGSGGGLVVVGPA